MHLKQKRKFKKWIKTKQIDIKNSGTKSKEKELEGLIWKCRGSGKEKKKEKIKEKECWQLIEGPTSTCVAQE